MKFFVLACVAALVPSIQASANFRATCNGVNNQMSALSKSIGQIKATANKLGHRRISSKCDEASNHLSFAQSSWGGISSGFLSTPWRARSSPHASSVQGRMSSCGSALNWIYNQPEIRHPDYTPRISGCQSNYRGCQSGCQSVWDWPSPPNYDPQPSGGHNSDYYRRHKRQASLCPSHETACPISDVSSGHECLDTQSELTSCGGCVSKGDGENCLSIPGADGVGCLEGTCVVFSVKPGYVKNAIGRPELA